METKLVKPQKQAFQLKGSLYTLTALQLESLDLALIKSHLEELINRTPKFFNQMPMVIDLQKVNRSSHPCDFQALVNLLRDLKLIPVGVKGGNTTLNQDALNSGLAIMPTSKRDSDPEPDAEKLTPEASVAAKTEPSVVAPITFNNKYITSPVRSGQQIYAKNGDLIVLASVSYGAELIADGSIHVYGSLRGRALAGVSGDRNARIFCRELDAELVSVAGHYLVKENIQFEQPANIQIVQVYLGENNVLRISAV